MFYDNEFSYKTVGSVINARYARKIHKFIFQIWVGDNLVRLRGDAAGILAGSKPNKPLGMPINMYETVVISICDEHLIRTCKPGEIIESLKYLDSYWLTTTNNGAAYVATEQAEDIYVAICEGLGVETLSSASYCDNCGCFLKFKQNKCWACEHGI